MNILLSIMCMICAIYLAFFQGAKCNHISELQGGLWVTRDAKGVVLSTSPDRPLFSSPLFNLPIKGISTYGYEWKYQQEAKRGK